MTKVLDDVVREMLRQWFGAKYANFDPSWMEKMSFVGQIAYDAGRRDEREECAKIAEDHRKGWLSGEATTVYGNAYQSACVNIESAIRARGD